MCKLLYSSRFASCSYLVFFGLVVVPHIDSRTWMIYGRLPIHKIFGTNPVVFPWLPVFPCFRVFSIDGLNPLLFLFRVSFQCWKKIKLKKVRTMYSPDSHDGNYARSKTPSSISAADLYWYCSQPQHKSSFPYVKILVSAIFFLKTRRSSKNLTRSNLKPVLFIPTRSQSHAIFNRIRTLELRTSL